MGERKFRVMLPMTIRCNTCQNYMVTGTKFNSRREDVVGEANLGVQIFRFYIKCSKCKAEITMKTGPNTNYAVESGGTARNVYAEDELL